jgi:hypothetical protein
LFLVLGSKVFFIPFYFECFADYHNGQLRLKAAKVLIVGAGGLGCPAAAYIAGAGVGTIGIVDGDVVETSNLHRQILHSTSKVGMKKVDSAIEFLKSFVPGPLLPFTRLTDDFKIESKLEIRSPHRAPRSRNRRRYCEGLRFSTRLHRPPHLPLPHLRHLHPPLQTPNLRLRPPHRRPTHRPELSPLTSRKYIRRPLLPLCISQTTSCNERHFVWRWRYSWTSCRNDGCTSSS